MKKVICFAVVFVLAFSCVAYAAPAPSTASISRPAANRDVATKENPVLLDTLETAHYAISAFFDGEFTYCITILDNGDVEFSWAGVECGVGKAVTSLKELSFKTNTPLLDAIGNKAFLSETKAWGESQMITTHSTLENDGYIARGANPNYIYQLTNQLSAIHGSTHTGYYWAGAEYYNGLRFSYLEDLDYGIEYRGDLPFFLTTTLGDIATQVMAFFPTAGITLHGLSLLFNVVDSVNTQLKANGTISYYYGDAIYNRYVKIEDGGPYYQCFKTVYYDGWVLTGDINKVELEETGDMYNPTEDIFYSKDMQRVRAYANY